MEPPGAPVGELRHHDALMRRVRIAAGLFAVVQLWVYTPPPGIQRPFTPVVAIVAVWAALSMISLASWWVARGADVARLRRSAAGQLVADGLVVLGLVALFGFDPQSNVWALMLVPVLEGAVRLRLWGAVGAWLGLAPGYALVEGWAVQAHPHVATRPSQVTFVIGLVGVVAFTVGLLARHLHERTEQFRAAQARLADLVYVDALTALPNRARLLGSLDRLDDTDGGFTIVFLDLDRFKDVNDHFGHEVGDQLLCAVAERLQEAVRPTDLVARLAGDEFVIVLPTLTDRETVLAALGRLRDAAAATMLLDGELVDVGVSTGAAVARADGTARPRGREVLRQADAAMYVAKHRGDGEPVVVDACDEEVPAAASSWRASADGPFRLHDSGPPDE